MSDAAPSRGRLLEAVFRRIEAERMVDVPILNDKLHVQWLEGPRDEDATLGVLITSWFMSLVRLPTEGTAWQGKRVGDEVVRHYPSGRYRFLINEEPELGCYQSCSLFSPVFEFADQQAAAETARHVLAALYDDQHKDAGDVDSEAIARRWQGAAINNVAEADADDVAGDGSCAEEAQPPQLDRRAFLTGRRAGNAPQSEGLDSPASETGVR